MNFRHFYAKRDGPSITKKAATEFGDPQLLSNGELRKIAVGVLAALALLAVRGVV